MWRFFFLSFIEEWFFDITIFDIFDGDASRKKNNPPIVNLSS